MMVSSRRGNKRPLLHEPEGGSRMARTIFPLKNFTPVEDALCMQGVFLVQC